MSEDIERFDSAVHTGRIAYEHAHRYAICKDLVATRKVLDLACGTGYGSNILAGSAAVVAAVDISPVAIREARRRYTRENLSFSIADAYDLPFDAENFDVVVANEMIEHVDDHDGLILEVKRVLSDRGIFLVSTPNRPVYNRYKTPNPFHVSEMAVPEFESLLRRHFRNVKLVGTRMTLLSASYDLDGASGAQNLASARVYHGSRFDEGRIDVENTELWLRDPEYVLAICSDGDLERDAAFASIYFSRDDDLWQGHEKILAWASGLHGEDEQLRSDLERARSELDELRNDHAAQAELRAAHQIAAQLVQQNEHAFTTAEDRIRSEAQSRANTFSSLMGRILDRDVGSDDVSLIGGLFELNQILTRRNAEVAFAERQAAQLGQMEERLAEQTLEVARLQQAVATQQQAVALVEQDLADARKRLDGEHADHQVTRTALNTSRHHLAEVREQLFRELDAHSATRSAMNSLQLEQQALLAEMREQFARELNAHAVTREALDSVRFAQRELSDKLVDEARNRAASERRMGELEVAVAQMEIARSQGEARADRFYQAKTDAEAQLCSERVELADLRAKLDSLEQQLELQRSQAGSLDTYFEHARQDLGDARALADQYRPLIEDGTRVVPASQVAAGDEVAKAWSQPERLVTSDADLGSEGLARFGAEAAHGNRTRNLASVVRHVRSELDRAHPELPAALPHSPRPWIMRKIDTVVPKIGRKMFKSSWVERANPSLGRVSLARYLRDPQLYGIDPHPLFSGAYYLANNADVAATGLNPLRHYLEFGWREARDPHPWFANDWYLSRNPDVAAADINPLQHYLDHGWSEGRWPNPVFDPQAYLSRYPDVAKSGMEPLSHYIMFGCAEGRDLPIAGVDPDWRQLVANEHRGQDLLTFVLTAELTEAAAIDGNTAPLAREAVDPTWPPERLDDYWLPQLLRDVIIDNHGEDVVGLYWYLCSVMARYQERPEGFPSSQVCGELRQRLSRRAADLLVRANGEVDASIIIPVFNNVLDTLLCVATVLETASQRTFEIIIADDGSSDETPQLLATVGGAVRYIRQSENLGFLGNCNEAAKHARGQHVVLLNNDTLVLPGWLDQLLAPFEQHHAVGLVGSKLLNWDGSLQEAGGIFWEDGSAWNYGRGQDARACEFNYLKDTDYCSGASIAIPRDLWEELGGFDPIFTPAYCEDSDIAFRIRSLGYRTVYQPASEVIHHEGRSHGRDVSSGIKAYQIANQRKLLERWRSSLCRDHFPNAQQVLRARDRSRFKRHILVIDHYVPEWDRDAGSRTMYQFLLAMVGKGWSVTFWPDNLNYSRRYAQVLQAHGIEVLYGSRWTGKFAEFCSERQSLYDAVLVSRPHIAVSYLDDIREYLKIPIWFYGHDVHFRRMELQREQGLPGAPGFAAVEDMRMLELRVCNGSNLVLYPSRDEAEFMARLVSGNVICKAITPYSYPEALVASVRERLSLPAKPAGEVLSLLFVGGFGHHPNVDGLIWFAQDVATLLRQRKCRFHLKVVGSKATAEIWRLGGEDIDVLGFVSDAQLDQLYRDADLVIAPLRYGAGVKGKVVEAMANGVPVVTTSVGAQGLDGAQDALFLGDSADEFANAVIAGADPNDARKRARKAVEYVAARFSPHAISQVFEDALLGNEA